jgi:hypothetical protein
MPDDQPTQQRRAAPLSVFNAVEASELKPLPQRRFVLATWSRATIGPDIHVKVGRCLYSIPWRFIGQKFDARSTITVVQIFHDGNLIATHPRPRASRPTWGTTRRRRSRSRCGPRPGAAPVATRSDLTPWP